MSYLRRLVLGALQVEEADLRHPKQKVIVADSLYGNHIFLAIILVIQQHFGAIFASLKSSQIDIGKENKNIGVTKSIFLCDGNYLFMEQ
jgi:hypothetical protein